MVLDQKEESEGEPFYDILWEPVDYNPNDLANFREGKICNKVPGQVLPGPWVQEEALEDQPKHEKDSWSATKNFWYPSSSPVTESDV